MSIARQKPGIAKGFAAFTFVYVGQSNKIQKKCVIYQKVEKFEE